ncbi:MAG TPA: hypothetical protein VJ044_16925, partial [Candidatus Hodarchaeales archaeon]|nr:hypothetical protein [Candidatus Hodarchaeales archaeon]
GELFPDFVWRNEQMRFLRNVELVNWNTTFVLPNRTGRLHVAIRSGTRRQDSKPLILFELTARGIDRNNPSRMSAWFKMAHEWIVRGFSDLTSKEVQEKIWQRTK